MFPIRPGVAVAITEGEIPAGGALYNELLRDISVNESLQVSRALGEIYNIRRIRPGDAYSIYHTTDGVVLKFIFDPDPMINYVLERSSEGLAGYEEIPEFEERTVLLKGVIESSLYAGLAGSEITDPATIMRFADIFQWQMDFLTEVRAGDQFKLVFTKFYVDNKPVKYGRILVAEYSGKRGNYQAVNFQDRDYPDYYDLDGNSLRKQFLRAPLEYKRISSHFSRTRMHPIHRVVRPHLGIDYAAPSGTPVSALGDGRVTFVGWRGGYGNTVRIRHNQTYTSQYGHLRGFARGLKVGQTVRQGELIGYVGMTGTATGPHLDFRFEVNGVPVNFLTQNLPSAENISAANLSSFKERVLEVREYLDLLEDDFFLANPATIEEFRTYQEELALSQTEL